MGSSQEDEETYGLPDFNKRFIKDEELEHFENALSAPEAAPLVAINDWRPIHQRVRKPGQRRKANRTVDETREGYLYTILKWPLLSLALGWISVLSVLYILTRLYIYLYEHLITWRGKRQTLRRQMRTTRNYGEWKEAAKKLDSYLGNDKWKDVNEYAYYDHGTVSRVKSQLEALRAKVEQSQTKGDDSVKLGPLLEDLRVLLEGCVKHNFAGVENPRLYSETYFGTKHLVQQFIDEVHASLQLILRTKDIPQETKEAFFKHLETNYGRTALCLSGGATFSYYHFGVAKALLDNGVLPDIISGTSGGALVAALVATRTDEELKKLLVPELAYKIKACEDPLQVWIRRWWRTGARFDTLDWAEKCSWFCRGSTTFLEAYQRTGRILNVSCVPSDPHSPTILANYLTSPHCVIWSAVIASAAVPGILNPVVLMMKKPDGTLAPYSFGHKWKDGSLRTDIPLKALDIHFNANFPIVSQVNPHISLFFFSSRGSVGRPVTHRKGRGWRGGFLGSATEQYIKLDLNKWLKVLRHLELLPRPLGQDWSEIWLQRFSGIVTIWPKTSLSDLYYILTDPTPDRLSHMIQEGQHSTFPKIQFIKNRMKLEKVISEALKRDGRAFARHINTPLPPEIDASANDGELDQQVGSYLQEDLDKWQDGYGGTGNARVPESDNRPHLKRRSSVLEEIRRQSAVFFDDLDEAGPSED
ncbi:patatin-like phospholipase domain-containing protein, variant 2 [Blastomyces dermatitidis ER-3]|uniref:Patatin-like phospholipase domain-containing protein n=3 Tax=Blastomyces TaxID=229219 RepID=A0A179V398_BLAGS|nr:patatin-like phospholipase domain-containing protein [Blastomyces gilchristii SLH14081]XP_031581164.1 patatin-like phospholipase domain-containing protein, variant [Blastomyces gilchristii SLH14081]XP_045273896.1 patatin-like phospholipase domain-containing protein [Blastomyces dermatitidis ER-3]XP_045279588.1 patatin-like phospholipase domain-containing protein, variant 1 [Blastomyces dermatitidis ER-3]XP_045279589.1 patatin-like phospholipase domain-containing protein, variant 2 [Blastomyc